MASISKYSTLKDYQDFIKLVYSVPDDRYYSLEDIIANQQRFTMRALKGLRKRDFEKLSYNLMIGFSWLMAVCNRLHIQLDKAIIKRFPNVCSYCKQAPCVCKKDKYKKVTGKKIINKKEIITISDFQEMFENIYPSGKRSLEDSGIHLAEEMGELGEAVNIFLGEHIEKEFGNIQVELADFSSCLFGVANSSKFNVAKSLSKLYKDNCHICHKIPCICTYSSVSKFNS